MKKYFIAYMIKCENSTTYGFATKEVEYKKCPFDVMKTVQAEISLSNNVDICNVILTAFNGVN